ncbi:MAG: hypothetical protein WCB85_02025 [Candidatus Dormiibacterota bacterium]
MSAAFTPDEPTSPRRLGHRWRLLGILALVAAAAALVASIALGALSTNGAGTGSASTGSVALTTNGSATMSCTVGPMAPGDSSTGWSGNPITGQTDTKSAPCTLSVTYAGSLSAFIGLGVSGENGLYDGTPNGLQLQISDGVNSYSTSGAVNPNTASDPLYVATDPGTASGGGHTYDFTVNYALPRTYSSSPDTQDNTYQGRSTTLVFTVYAVQTVGDGYATTNGMSGGPACTPGQQCSGITAWS